MSWLNTWTWVSGYGSMITFLLLLFPTGRLLSRRWRPIAWLSALAMALMVLAAAAFWRYRGVRLLLDSSELESSLGPVWDLFGIGFPLLLLCGLASTVSLLVRLRRSRGDERQQLKWFTYAAAAVAVFAITIEGILGELVTGWEVIGNVFGILLIPCIPIATGIAILKYRLYDIDRIINRTLVYGGLSAVLAGVYALCVVVLPALAGVGRGSQVVVATSTLLVAALFTPVRRRVQGFIDRRFYRSRYDAVRTVEAFSIRLRNEVDLEAMRADLLAAVRETMQPRRVSVWLKS